MNDLLASNGREPDAGCDASHGRRAELRAWRAGVVHRKDVVDRLQTGLGDVDGGPAAASGHWLRK
jgi:hypothetical protein